MTPVELQRFGRDQVRRQRVAAERVQDQQVIIGRRLAFQRKPSVPQDNFVFRLAIGQVTEVTTSDPLDFGVDFVKPKEVSRRSVCSQRTHTQSDDANAFRYLLRHVGDGQANPTIRSEIHRWAAAELRIKMLESMGNPAVHHVTSLAQWIVSGFFRQPQDTVEVS